MAENEWISVEDLLPPELEECYVWIPDKGMDVGCLFHNIGWGAHFHGFNLDVKYWTPLIPTDLWVDIEDCLPLYDGWYVCYFGTDEDGIDNIMPIRFSAEKGCFYSTFEDDPKDGWKHDDVKKWIGWPSPPQSEESNHDKTKIVLHDSKEDPPVGYQGITLGFHADENGLEGRIAMYIPRDGGMWVGFGDLVKNEEGEDAYEFDDITDWVDYWAPLPDEMYAEDALKYKNARLRGEIQ